MCPLYEMVQKKEKEKTEQEKDDERGRQSNGKINEREGWSTLEYRGLFK